MTTQPTGVRLTPLQARNCGHPVPARKPGESAPETVMSAVADVSADSMRNLARQLAHELAGVDNISGTDHNPKQNEVHVTEYVLGAGSLESCFFPHLGSESPVKDRELAGGPHPKYDVVKIRLAPDTKEVELMYAVQSHYAGCKSFFRYEAASAGKPEDIAYGITYHNRVMIPDPFDR